MDSYPVLLGLKPANCVFDLLVWGCCRSLVDGKTPFSTSRPSARALESIRSSLASPLPPPPTKRIKPLEGKLQKVSKIHFQAFALE